MANLIDFGGQVNSNLVQGLGTNTVTFTMPGNIGLAVESVLATINNSAGGNNGMVLTVRDQSGEVIAKKRQSRTIPAGGTGTATWALRLADNDDGNIIEYSIYEYFTNSASPQPQYTGYPLDDVEYIDGPELLDVSDPENPFVISDGVYTFNWQCLYTLHDNAVAPHYPTTGDFHGYSAHFFMGSGSHTSGFIFPEGEIILPLEVWQGTGTSANWPIVSATLRVPLLAGDFVSGAFVQHNVPLAAPESRFLKNGTPAVNLMLTREDWMPTDFPA